MKNSKEFKPDKTQNTITRARKGYNYSIEELASKTGIPDFVIKSIESGKRIPSIEELHELSIALNMSYLDIVEDLMDATQY